MAQRDKILVWVANIDMRIHLVNVINRSGNYEAIEYRAGVEGMEAIYTQKPQLLLLDVDYALPDPEKVIQQVRNNLSGTYIIGLSSRWDERKRHQMEEMFDGVLTMPFDIDSFERVLEEAKKVSVSSTCEVLTFFAPKGKSGRTTLIVNLALNLARLTGEKVGIIDAETTFADMDAFLNINPQSTIVEALRDLSLLAPSTLAKYYEEVVPNVQVLCGAKNAQQVNLITAEALTDLIAMSRRCFRYILVDLAPGFSPVTMAACEAADKVYLTTMSGGTFELKHLKRSLDIFHAMDDWQSRVECVITRITPEVRQRTILEDELGCPVTLIPNEYHLCAQAANNGRMATDIGPKAALTQQIDLMAKAIVEKNR
ncbi:MAG: AAA family ATPase [Phascolarctobacterium sp.]|nr:AAA family ATPase [Phascolarctobacterium sp.]